MATPFQMFAQQDLTLLRGELMHGGLDCFQAAELLSMFIHERGYGVSSMDTRHAVLHLPAIGFALAGMRAELERIAFAM